MITRRIIARLDIKGSNLVKGIHLEGLRVLGDPGDFAQFYYESGADELFFQDVVASLYERNSLHDIISRTARRGFIPLTVGGGIRTIEDIKGVLRAGADKVALNTAAVKNPQIIKEAVHKFGSSTIVVAIECIRQPNGQYGAFVDNGREETGKEVLAWAQEVERLGAGEIVLTSVDREGTGKGYDLELTEMVTTAVGIPVIAHGGAGRLEHFSEAIATGKADALAVASVIHYDFVKNSSKMAFDNHTEGNLSFLQSGRTSFSQIQAAGIPKIKEYLLQAGFDCRI